MKYVGLNDTIHRNQVSLKTEQGDSGELADCQEHESNINKEIRRSQGPSFRSWSLNKVLYTCRDRMQDLAKLTLSPLRLGTDPQHIIYYHNSFYSVLIFFLQEF